MIPNHGAEVGKVRPVVVIQANPLIAAGLATVLVVPLTTQRRQGAELGDGPLTSLDEAEIEALEQALRGVMGLA